MVISNDFLFQVVLADDKTPFKEHQNGNNTFVEVEPDAEYYLSIQRLKKASVKHLYCVYRIDGKWLGYTVHTDNEVSAQLKGIHSRSPDGDVYQKALRFAKVPVNIRESATIGDTNASSTMYGMGKIELEVYEAIEKVVKVNDDNGESSDTDDSDDTLFKPLFDVANAISTNNKAFVTKKKNVRSIEGCQSYSPSRKKSSKPKVTKRKSPKRLFRNQMLLGTKPSKQKLITRGRKLYTITLHYCSAPALIAVGVLPQPPAWEHARRNTPAELSPEEREKLEKQVISVRYTRRGNEIIELADSE